MEIKQHLKLSQQLVMTPQLQQAIKLLQLSRMELVRHGPRRDAREPDPRGLRSSRPASRPRRPSARRGRRRGPTSSASARPRRRSSRSAPTRSTRPPRSRPTADSNEAVNDFDWEGYLDNQAAAAPMPSYKSQQRGPAVARVDADARARRCSTTSSGSSSSSHFTREEDGIAMLIIGNLDARRLPRGAARGPRRGGRA